MSSMQPLGSLRALVILILIASGCGESRRSAAVEGTVTIGGQPAGDLVIRFQPVGTGASPKQDAGMGSYGRTDSDGRFQMRFSDTDKLGASPGEQVVIIDELTPPEEEHNDAGGMGKKVVSRIPKAWRDGSQRFTVKEGSSEANFELKK